MLWLSRLNNAPSVRFEGCRRKGTSGWLSQEKRWWSVHPVLCAKSGNFFLSKSETHLGDRICSQTPNALPALIHPVQPLAKTLAGTVNMEAFKLPSVPEGWSAEKDFKPLGKLSPATQRNIEPVGAQFLAEARRKRHKRTFSEDERMQAQEKVRKTEDEDDGEISDNEDPVMLQRDAKDWKVRQPSCDRFHHLRRLLLILPIEQAQDHYAVLGLSKFRYKATDDQIKRANRKKVLKHHPDKRAAIGGTEDDSFFKCIQKATEILLDPTKRRQFDSVDEEANVDPPSKKESKSASFFKLWNPVFDSEARFSRTQPVPRLGDDKSTKEQVESFYNFWYNFDSWRSFEYQDEDVPDDSADRDQKRHIERKNLNARKKKKTEDTARLRKLVDDALSLDDRIAKFKKQEKEQKNKKKNEREAEAKLAAEEAAQKKAQEEKLRQEKEAAEKAEKAEGKKAKEAAKNAVKKNKRTLRNAVKDGNHFHAGGEAPPQQIQAALDDVESMMTRMEPEEIASVTSKLSSAKDATSIKAVFKGEEQRLVEAGKLKEGEFKSLKA